ncbi:MAG: hypothetical protein U0637_07855 [Phycisphaerales bacterium]
MLRRVAAVAVVAACGAAAAQPALYSNASSIPGAPALSAAMVTVSGVAAPAGGMWSEVGAVDAMSGNALAGVACQADSAGGVRVADDFVVPAGQVWSLERLAVFVYEPGRVGAGPPVIGGTLRVWQGSPAAGGLPVFGDTGTNRLHGVEATGVYRVFSTIAGTPTEAPGVSRPLYRVELDMPVQLGAGVYWVDWELTPATPGAWLFAVPATVLGERTGEGWNAQQFLDGSWRPVMDPGRPVGAGEVALDMAFVLLGAGTAGCDTVDFNGDEILPDIQDIADFLTVFAGGPCPTGACHDIDFNNDGLFPDTQDIASLLGVFAGGPCV